MFKIIERKSTESAQPIEVGHGYSTREEALAGLRKHLKTFGVSGHNAEESYWWARDSEGLRKCWITNAE